MVFSIYIVVAALATSVEIINLDSKPHRASAFTAKNSNVIENAGVNGIFQTPNSRLPQIIRDTLSQNISDVDLAAAIKVVARGLLFSMSYFKVPETSNKEKSVDNTLSPLFYGYFNGHSNFKKYSLTNLNADVGPTSSDSIPDFVHFTTKDSLMFGLLVVEFKDTSASTLEQMGQAFASGCNIILSLLKLDLRCNELAVPLILTNGNLYQFLWITLLEPAFPVSHVTTCVLDASDEHGMKLIAENLFRVKRFCNEMISKIQNIPASNPSKLSIKLDLSLYHIKYLENVFLRSEEKNESIWYLWQVYNKICNVKEAVLPLAYTFLKKNLDNQSRDCFIYPRLSDGFKVGVPADNVFFEKYIEALRTAIKNIHIAGVVHVDLYPSNIIFRIDDENVVIRIVDWDAATFIGDSFTQKMNDRLNSSSHKPYYWPSIEEKADKRCDYWFLFILSQLSYDERLNMNGGAVDVVNSIFVKCVERLRENGKLLEFE